MPIYIVRWPDFSASLLRADDEDALEDLLDEVGDPAGCRWAIYDGPLWIDLELPVRIRDGIEQTLAVSANKIHFQGVRRLLEAEELAYRVTLGGGESRCDMVEAVTAWAFPALHRVVSEAIDEPPTRRELIRALRNDVVEMLKYAWRRAQIQKRTDLEGTLLTALGLTKAPPWLRTVISRHHQKHV